MKKLFLFIIYDILLSDGFLFDKIRNRTVRHTVFGCAAAGGL